MDKIAGRNQVLEALRAGRRVDRILVAYGADAPEVFKMAQEMNITVDRVERRYLDGLVKERHQGVMAYAEAIAYSDVSMLMNIARTKGEPALLVALNNVQDPQNLGSVLRSADGAGAHGIIVPSRRSAGLTTAVGRASAGAMEHVRVAQVTNMARTLDELGKQNVWSVGFDGEAKTPFWEADFTMPTVLVIGGESKGLGRLVSEKCDTVVNIPMLGKVNSLNAGVAAALALYEARRQRALLA